MQRRSFDYRSTLIVAALAAGLGVSIINATEADLTLPAVHRDRTGTAIADTVKADSTPSPSRRRRQWQSQAPRVWTPLATRSLLKA